MEVPRPRRDQARSRGIDVHEYPGALQFAIRRDLYNPKTDGVACWLTPGKTTPTFNRLARIGIRSAPFQLGWTGFRRYSAIENYCGEVHKHIVPGKHWYLWGLGVEPSRQGYGIGGMLMQPVIAQADADHAPCYLETMNVKNVPFYKKHGFKVVSDDDVPRHSLHVWAMLREPRW